MRVVIAGTPAARRRLRAELEAAGIDIAAEFDTLEDARAATVRADALLIANDDRRRETRDEPDRLHEPLTPREREVLELLAEGLSNKSIASRLGVSDQTIKFHVASILGKLGASNRTDAVRRALGRGLISL